MLSVTRTAAAEAVYSAPALLGDVFTLADTIVSPADIYTVWGLPSASITADHSRPPLSPCRTEPLITELSDKAAVLSADEASSRALSISSADIFSKVRDISPSSYV